MTYKCKCGRKIEIPENIGWYTAWKCGGCKRNIVQEMKDMAKKEAGEVENA